MQPNAQPSFQKLKVDNSCEKTPAKLDLILLKS